MRFPAPVILDPAPGCCPICGALLPCYGSGLSWPDMEVLARTDRLEAMRRIKEHTRRAVREAGSEGLTERGIALALGMDPRGCDDVARVTVKAERIN